MSNAAVSPSAQPRSPLAPNTTLVTTVVLVIWLMLVFFLGAGGAFVTPTGTPPLPLLVGVVVPISVFLAGFRLSRPFHDFILAADLRFMTGLQAWRFAGFGFLALYAHGVLPGAFAWPAGLGDMALGITAPWVVTALMRRSGFAAGRLFRIWNLLGILDLIVAVGTGGLIAALATGAAGEITTRPMAQLPLVLIPDYLVPIFIMLHAAALLQARRLAGYAGERA